MGTDTVSRRQRLTQILVAVALLALGAFGTAGTLSAAPEDGPTDQRTFVATPWGFVRTPTFGTGLALAGYLSRGAYQQAALNQAAVASLAFTAGALPVAAPLPGIAPLPFAAPYVTPYSGYFARQGVQTVTSLVPETQTVDYGRTVACVRYDTTGQTTCP